MGWLLRRSSVPFGRHQPEAMSHELWALAGSQTGQTHPTQAIACDRAQPKRQSKPYQVAVILPVYNEQACLNTTFDAVLAYARAHPTYQFIFVNDGSSDGTKALLEKRLARSPAEQLTLVSYASRQGKGHAVKTGIALVTSDYVCFLDSDLAYSLDHLDRLLEKLKEADVVIGCRHLLLNEVEGLQPMRKLAGKVFNLLSQWILNLHFSDMQAGIKGFRTASARSLFAKQVLKGFSFDVELVYLAKKHRLKVDEIPAHVSLHHAKKVSKVHLGKDSLRMLLDLFKIRYYDVIKRYD